MHRAPDPCGRDVSRWSEVVPGSDWGPVPGGGKFGFPAIRQGKGATWGAAGLDPAWGAEQQCPRGLCEPTGCRQVCGAVGALLGLLVMGTQVTAATLRMI